LGQVVRADPDLIIHAAAWTEVDECETDPARAFSVNALGTRHIAEAAAIIGAHVTYISTDYVFSGLAERPYTEWDEADPLNVYGASKLAGERELDGSSTVIRTSWLFGRGGSNVVKTVLAKARAGDELRFVTDQVGSPTSAADLAHKVIELSIARRRGIYHVTNQGTASWFDFAKAVLGTAGEDPNLVQPINTSELRPPRAATRPGYSVLDNAALRLCGDRLLPPWKDSLAEVVRQLRDD
jgi:dTDP-4-dehydrorhamnose reductase